MNLDYVDVYQMCREIFIVRTCEVGNKKAVQWEDDIRRMTFTATKTLWHEICRATNTATTGVGSSEAETQHADQYDVVI